MSVPASSGTRVYPRACGGTRLDSAISEAAQGLSPRLRGNLGVEGDRVIVMRSIPAPAGEPDNIAIPG